MNNLPEISVIVPVYKVEKYLPQCIDSILAQTFTDFELLLVDDGSPDRCGRFVKSMPGRIRGYRFPSGQCRIELCQKYRVNECLWKICDFIDSDDYVKPCYLESLYGALPADKTKEGVIVRFS